MVQPTKATRQHTCVRDGSSDKRTLVIGGLGMVVCVGWYLDMRQGVAGRQGGRQAGREDRDSAAGTAVGWRLHFTRTLHDADAHPASLCRFDAREYQVIGIEHRHAKG